MTDALRRPVGPEEVVVVADLVVDVVVVVEVVVVVGDEVTTTKVVDGAIPGFVKTGVAPTGTGNDSAAGAELPAGNCR